MSHQAVVEKHVDWLERELAEARAAFNRVCEERLALELKLNLQVQHEHPWGPRNNGDTTSFYSCGICGASVQPMDRETHIEWHRRVS